MSAPFVSIIIPCYNTERYVADAIRSSLEQTYPHKEVIVIDDGSSDGSVEAIKAFGSEIRWETGPNRGACAARNRGLQLARGERIQFLDADDWLYPQKLERQLDGIKSNAAATPICHGEVIDNGRAIQRYLAPPSCQDSLVPLLRGPLQILSPIHLKSNLDRIGGFREELPCAQDRDLHLRLASHGWPLVQIPETLYATRRIPGSVSSSYERVLLQHLTVARGVREILESRGQWTDQNARVLAGFLSSDARKLVRFGRDDDASRFFQLARKYHPTGWRSESYGTLTGVAARMIGPVRLEHLLTRFKRLM